MTSASTELHVTLSPDLYRRLRREARRLGVPMEYLVASVVVDTFEEAETCAGRPERLEPALAS